MPKTQKGRNKYPKIVSTSSCGLPKWKQSPVDLNKIHTWSENFKPLMLTGHWLREGVATMTNTGQTVKIEMAKRTLPSIRGGPLNDDQYQFENLQFRWGPSNCRGAEHSIDNMWYSMEAQALHWNNKYDTIDKCYEKSDGIAILSFLLQVVGCSEAPDNPRLTDITDYLSKIKKSGTTVPIAPDLTAGLIKTGKSPINLDDSVVNIKKFPPLTLNGHWLKDGEAILWNNGETAMVNLTGHRIPSTITGGPLLNDVYEYHDAHFHWGKENCNGSEHHVNGTWYSMEAHIVHWNRKYQTFNECLKHRDGICVLAYFFLVTEKSFNWKNPLVDIIIENLKYIVNPDSEKKIPANALCWMRDATRCPSYYTYLGSYNKGSCPECATWIIFPLIIPIAACQIEEFRKLLNHEGAPIIQNWKEIQPPNGRRIFSAATTP